MSRSMTLGETYAMYKYEYSQIQSMVKGLSSEKVKNEYVEPYRQKLLKFCNEHPEFKMPESPTTIVNQYDRITLNYDELAIRPLTEFEFEKLVVEAHLKGDDSIQYCPTCKEFAKSGYRRCKHTEALKELKDVRVRLSSRIFVKGIAEGLKSHKPYITGKY